MPSHLRLSSRSLSLLFSGLFLPLCPGRCSVSPSVRRSIEPKASKMEVGVNVQVSRDRSADPHFEVIVAASEKAPAQLLVGSIVRVAPTRDICVAYASEDAGKTWRLAYTPKLPATPEFTIFDPAVAFGPRGEAYFGALFTVPIPGPHIPEYYMEIACSRDGGRIWDLPARIEGFNDRPYLSVDNSPGNHRGRLYCNSGLHGGGHGVRTSDNRGKSFLLSSEARLRVAPPAQVLNTGQSAVLSDGTLVVPYLYFTKRDGEQKGTGKENAQEVGLSVCRSENGGASLLYGKPQIARGLHTDRDGLPNLAVDTVSARFTNRCYLVWSEANSRGHRVMMAHSQDSGRTWSSPVWIDSPSVALREGRGHPEENPPGGHYDSFLPSAAVSKDGIVGVCWYDTRDVPTGKTGWDVRFCASLDGGETWLPSVRVSSATSLAPATDTGLGDTAGMAADAAGAFHPLWIDNRTGVKQVFTASVTVTK